MIQVYARSSGRVNLLANDTMWMHPQTHTEENMVFGITDPGRIRKIHFSDTSRMALLYIYRPGKLKLLYKTGNTKLEFTVMEPKEGKQDFDAIYKVE